MKMAPIPPLRSRFVKLMATSVILSGIVAAIVWLLSGTRSGNEVRMPAASGPQSISAMAHRDVERGPATLSPSQVRALKLPRGLHLARLPWPSGGKLPREFHLAQLPWLHDRGAADISRLHITASSTYGTGALANPLHLVHRAYVPWPKLPGFRLPITGKFVMALCRDKAGNIWIATEDHGVYRYDPAALAGQQVEQFTKQNTRGQLGNNNLYALACDDHGRIWAGTLNHGVSVWNGNRWQDYGIVENPKDHVLAGPLGNHIFALKFDKYIDQVWIGTDAGIAIYQCSSHASAPPGQPAGINPAARQYVTGNPSPVTFKPGTWHYITQADGLPQNPDCVAFNPNGTVYVGTQCDGVAIGMPITNSHIAAGSAGGGPSQDDPAMRTPYSAPYSWRVVTGPWKMPLTATGKGLPSNLINGLSVEPDGTVIVGTDEGIAFGSRIQKQGIGSEKLEGNNKDVAQSGTGLPPVSKSVHRLEADAVPVTFTPNSRPRYHWTFMRGRDFTAKVAGLWHPPQHWKAPSQEVLNTLPMEDYTTAIAVDEQRPMTTDLWLGHRRRGIDVWEYNTAGTIIKRWQIHEPQIGNYVTSLLPLPGGGMVVGTYGKGVSIIMLPGAGVAWKKASRTAAKPHVSPGSAGGNVSTTGGRAAPDTGHAIHEPKPAAAPGVRQLAALYQSLVKEPASQEPTGPRIVPITNDWRTQGSWLGRYGRYWACLFAIVRGPPIGDCVWAPGPMPLYHIEGIGPHHRLHDYGRYHIVGGDAIRMYLTWLYTANKRVLELPELYLDQCIAKHRATRIDDRRETEIDDHGETYPMAWQGPGLYVYLHIPAGAWTLSLYFFNKDGHSGKNRDRDYVVSMIPVPARYHLGPASPPKTALVANRHGSAQSRVVNFWDGVWKRFLVRGPMKLAIRVAKNYSLNTIIQAAMLDPLAEHPAPYYYGYKAWHTHEKQRQNFRTKLLAAWENGQIPWQRHPAHGPIGDPSAVSPSAITQMNAASLALAQRILLILDVLEHRNPVAWAANQQLAYTAILRWCVAMYGVIPKDREAAAIAEKCYYHLSLFHRWEAVEKSRGILTSRQIEKGLRWDGMQTSYRGFEGYVIRRHVRHLKHQHAEAIKK
ncbi:MAG: hypothetical protein M1472_03360 [Planctomycetes bacterium]|nr:hypothetical protein [Planctomycetota bacterium]